MKRVRIVGIRALVQVCAFVGAAVALANVPSTQVADACRWCTGPYTCQHIEDDGWSGCKVEGLEYCEHYGNPCFYIES